MQYCVTLASTGGLPSINAQILIYADSPDLARNRAMELDFSQMIWSNNVDEYVDWEEWQEENDGKYTFQAFAVEMHDSEDKYEFHETFLLRDMNCVDYSAFSITIVEDELLIRPHGYRASNPEDDKIDPIRICFDNGEPLIYINGIRMALVKSD